MQWIVYKKIPFLLIVVLLLMEMFGGNKLAMIALKEQSIGNIKSMIKIQKSLLHTLMLDLLPLAFNAQSLIKIGKNQKVFQLVQFFLEEEDLKLFL